MTEKRFTDIEVSADIGWIRLYTSDEDYVDYEGDEILEMLNSKDKQIFLLKSVIQTITAEAYEKDLSSKRIMEIKDYWYEKMKNEGGIG